MQGSRAELSIGQAESVRLLILNLPRWRSELAWESGEHNFDKAMAAGQRG